MLFVSGDTWETYTSVLAYVKCMGVLVRWCWCEGCDAQQNVENAEKWEEHLPMDT